MYRPYWFDRIAAGLDANGKPVAWNHRFAGSSIIARYAPARVQERSRPRHDRRRDRSRLRAAEHARRVCPGRSRRAFRPRSGAASGRRTTSSWSRASSTSSRRRRSRIRSPTAARCSTKSPRAKAVLDLAAEKAGWGQPLPARRGPRRRRCSTSSAATWRRSRRSRSRRTARCACAASSARSIAAPSSIPTPVRAQIESGDHLRHHRGAATARSRSRMVASSRPTSTTTRSLRIDEAPAIEVHIVQSAEAPGGIGEAGTSRDRAGGRQRDLRGDRQAPAEDAGRCRRAEAGGVRGRAVRSAPPL